MSEQKQPKCGGVHSKGDGSWWENDARGIPLARVCNGCIIEKLKKFRAEVLRDSNYWADEPIEGDNY